MELEYDDIVEEITQYDINSFFIFKNFIPISIQYQEKSSWKNLKRSFIEILAGVNIIS